MYSEKNTNKFIEQFKNIGAPDTSKVLSLGVSPVFMNVPLDYIMDIILRKVYRDKEISKRISPAEMKELFSLCTENVSFSYNGQLLSQTDGIATGSPLDPIITIIFTVKLKQNIVSELSLKENVRNF